VSHQAPFSAHGEQDTQQKPEGQPSVTCGEEDHENGGLTIADRIRIVCVVGARPNLVKIAPILRALNSCSCFDAKLVHTGQHHDPALSDCFFEDLAIPHPDAHLGVCAGHQSKQMAEIIQRFEPVVSSWQPHVVLVVGDVTSTLAGALVAAKTTLAQSFATSSGFRRSPLLVHVEAGLRSFDDTMPEEMNRRLTDSMADLLYVSEPSGLANLRREGIPDERIVLVGNVMIDSLLAERAKSAAATPDVLAPLGLEGPYGVVTLHRPANVDEPQILDGLLTILDKLAERLPLVFPVHPRTRLRLQASSVSLESPRWKLLGPLGYRRFARLLASARVVLTDSGGVQEETTFLGVPCLTLRQSTERPITVLVGRAPSAIASAFKRALASPPRGLVPDLWDGRAAERIVAHLLTRFEPAISAASRREMSV
jgi:UDP-N-acetylglucosamine 2-epimerase (non-hydrolysing)